LPFQQCSHLSNPWADNKKVSASKDGQVRYSACVHFEFNVIQYIKNKLFMMWFCELGAMVIGLILSVGCKQISECKIASTGVNSNHA